jgi:hypothetical protein
MPNAKRDTSHANQRRATVAVTGSSIGSERGPLGGQLGRNLGGNLGSDLGVAGDGSAPADPAHRSASDVVPRPTSDMPNAPSGIFQVAQKHGTSVLLAAADNADADRDRELFAAAMGDALDDILRTEIG